MGRGEGRVPRRMSRPRAPAGRVCWLEEATRGPGLLGLGVSGRQGSRARRPGAEVSGWASRRLPCVVCVGQEAAQGNMRCIDARCDHLLFYEWLKRDVK